MSSAAGKALLEPAKSRHRQRAAQNLSTSGHVHPLDLPPIHSSLSVEDQPEAEALVLVRRAPRLLPPSSIHRAALSCSGLSLTPNTRAVMMLKKKLADPIKATGTPRPGSSGEGG
jgi:hypothetical protein